MSDRLKSTRWLAVLVDDDAPEVRSIIETPLADRGIDLIVFDDPSDCLKNLRTTENPVDLLIADLNFPRQANCPEDGAYLAYRYIEMARQLNWHTIPTVLTNYFEEFFGEFVKIHQSRGFAPALIFDKSVLHGKQGPEFYASCLERLLKGHDLSAVLPHDEPLPSPICTEMPAQSPSEEKRGKQE
jgi:CheY-like chemotaxis protein